MSHRSMTQVDNCVHARVSYRHEGTQIEPAKPKTRYPDYKPHQPNFYLEKTLEHIERWEAALWS